MRTAFLSPSLEKKKISPEQRKKRILVIAGPTAAGKTNLSLALAGALGGEVVSADSVQVYRGMDIGTAKASAEQRALVAHHLLDVCDLSVNYNVAMFYESAQNAFKEIVSRDNVPIVVGGSGFYVHTLLYGPPDGPPSVPEVRALLEKQMEDLGADVLYERLQLFDPAYAATISVRDQHKIIRALEIMTLSEKRVSDFSKPDKLQEQAYDFRCWFIYYKREKLYPRIEARCDRMIAEGFLQEVRDLEQRGLRGNGAAAQAIGYRQALEFLDSPQTDQDKERFIMEFKKASRRFAKRQFTWFRAEPLFRWLDCDAYSPERLKEMILQDFEHNDF